jgi:hypothetical protein
MEKRNIKSLPPSLKLRQFNSRKETVIGEDLVNNIFYKIQVVKNKNKNYNLKGEYDILCHLNSLGCQSAPTAYSFFSVAREEIISRLETDEDKKYVESLPESYFNCICQEYIPNNADYILADVVFSLIEQKSLSVYHGDIKPENIRFDKDKNICIFVDYDQSIMLSDEGENSKILPFLDFCDDYDKEKYSVGDWLRHFKAFTKDSLKLLFNKSGAFNLAESTIYKTQCTTNANGGIYHTIENEYVYAKGVREINERSKLLDEINFRKGEKVLDIGCNSGLLCLYLDSLGCSVTGIDNDKYIPIAAKMVSNIHKVKDVNFLCMDLDEEESLEDYDTIMLFSVLHHTKTPELNAKKIASKCKRIIIESRLVESGKQPSGNGWCQTTNWIFNSVEELIEFYEQIFPGFELSSNLGKADKNRYLLVFSK